MNIKNLNINIKSSNFHDNATVFREGSEVSVIQESSNETILQELQGLQQKLIQTDSDTARKIGELQDAIKKQDKLKISTMIKDLTTGTIGSVIAELASATLKKFFGLP